MSDIEFSDNSQLFLNRFDVQGWLYERATLTAAPTAAPNPFGSSPPLQSGGLAFEPRTVQLWCVELEFSDSEGIFRIDPDTGITCDIVALTLGSQPTRFAFDSLAILGDGRLFGTTGTEASR